MTTTMEKAEALLEFFNDVEGDLILIDGELVGRSVIKEVLEAYLMQNVANLIIAADKTLAKKDAEITRLQELHQEELVGCKEKRLAKCPICSEKFFVDEDGSIDAFIGP